MTVNSEPLKGCEVLTPMLTPEETARRHDAQGKHPRTAGKGSRRGGRRFVMMNTFVDCTLATLPRTDALVWLVLFRDAHGGTAKSAQAYIAERAGVCVRTVKTAIKRLARAGLLDVLHRGGLHRGLSIYRIRSLAQVSDRGKIFAP
jgi:hypothetical protein